MAQDTHRFRCPCCHKQLEFETSTGEVREVDKRKDAQKRSKKEMDGLVERQKHEGERLGDAFTRATDDARDQAGKFDDMFKDALDAAKKDKDKKPRNPFDSE